MSEFVPYAGKELQLFEGAVKWKRYFSPFIKPYLKSSVIEVGPGLAPNTPLLNDGSADVWVMLEADAIMALDIEKKIKNGLLPSNCKVVGGTLSFLEKKTKYDSILYIDVLEHIKKDKEEIQLATGLLKPGGHLVVLSPAFRSLYSPFDKTIGHYTRYTKQTLRKLLPASLAEVDLRYLDSTGFFLSLANRLLLKQKYPTQAQVNTWNRYAIPVSRITDRIVNYSFGRSILGIWKKEGA
jgi:hypothetical protein